MCVCVVYCSVCVCVCVHVCMIACMHVCVCLYVGVGVNTKYVSLLTDFWVYPVVLFMLLSLLKWCHGMFFFLTDIYCQRAVLCTIQIFIVKEQ